MSKDNSLNNTSVSEYVKTFTQETTKEIIRARIHGKVFRMADFDKILANPAQYACEIHRWKTAIKKALKEDTSGIGKKHMFAWGPEDERPEDKYSDLPENGVPSNKPELVAIIKLGRLGAKFKRQGLTNDSPDGQFNDPIKELSGGVVTTYEDYMDVTKNAEISKAVELIRLTLSAALNNEMEVPFMNGQFLNYRAVMEWVDNKTETAVKSEYMYEYFKTLDEAISGDGQIDSKCMEFRMALEALYIDTPITFGDWEHNDIKAETFEPEGYTPSQSFTFLWTMQKQIVKAMGMKTWKEIEEEFKREIGATNYNKKGWMENKPILFKIIKRRCKDMNTAKIASVETTNTSVDNNSDDEFDLELEDGSVLKVQPKFKGSGSTWKQNFAQMFNLRQTGNNRWQQRRNNQHQQNHRSHPQMNDRNSVEQQKSATADQMWRCFKCRNEGNPKKYRGDQMCPKHNFRPKWFNSIPLASVREVKPASNGQNQTVDDKSGNTKDGSLAAIRSVFFSGYDSDGYNQ